MSAKVGDIIRIVRMKDEPQMSGKMGVIEDISIDPWGDRRFDGTWGGLAVYPDVDEYEIVVDGAFEEV